VTDQVAVVVVGGTRGLGLEIARHYVEAGRQVVITGQDPASVSKAVAELGGGTQGVAFDLASPGSIAPALKDVGPVQYLALVAIDRDSNSVEAYDIERAIRLVTLKLVGYTEVIHALRGRLGPESSVVLFGGMAKERPYPGSTTVSTVNGGIVGLTRSLVEELRPIRVNSLHPGIVGETPYWDGRPEATERARLGTPTERLATMADIVGGTVFLLENKAANGIELILDGGWHCR
jgi:NAD(P)-dependent dehydrogenase (short-subunit alcohol dehydrogenase family)